MQRFNRKSLFVDLLFFLMGCILTYAFVSGYYKDKVKTGYNLTVNIIDNCTSAFKAQDQLVTNRNQAYDEVAACLIGDSCNPTQTARRLNELNKEKGEIELKLHGLVQDMNSIIKKKKSD